MMTYIENEQRKSRLAENDAIKIKKLVIDSNKTEIAFENQYKFDDDEIASEIDVPFDKRRQKELERR
jgi:hypothetical protein